MPRAVPISMATRTVTPLGMKGSAPVMAGTLVTMRIASGTMGVIAHR